MNRTEEFEKNSVTKTNCLEDFDPTLPLLFTFVLITNDFIVDHTPDLFELETRTNLSRVIQ